VNKITKKHVFDMVSYVCGKCWADDTLLEAVAILYIANKRHLALYGRQLEQGLNWMSGRPFPYPYIEKHYDIVMMILNYKQEKEELDFSSLNKSEIECLSFVIDKFLKKELIDIMLAVKDDLVFFNTPVGEKMKLNEIVSELKDDVSKDGVEKTVILEYLKKD